jgi:hypothetical protein
LLLLLLFLRLFFLLLLLFQRVDLVLVNVETACIVGTETIFALLFELGL